MFFENSIYGEITTSLKSVVNCGQAIPSKDAETLCYGRYRSARTRGFGMEWVGGPDQLRTPASPLGTPQHVRSTARLDLNFP